MTLSFITVQRISPQPKGERDTSSLALSTKEPDVLRVVGVLPHQTAIRFDEPNLRALRAWIDTQLPAQSDSAPSLPDAIDALARRLDNSSPRELRAAKEHLREVSEDMAQFGSLRLVARALARAIRTE